MTMFARMQALGALLLVCLISITATKADTSALFGNTLVCSYTQGFDNVKRQKMDFEKGSSNVFLYVVKERAFEFFQAHRNTGTIYDFGQTRKDRLNANDSFQSHARLYGDRLELENSWEMRKSSFVNGATHYIKNQNRVFLQGSAWAFHRQVRQSSSGRGRMFFPDVSEQYDCNLNIGRVGL